MFPRNWCAKLGFSLKRIGIQKDNSGLLGEFLHFCVMISVSLQPINKGVMEVIGNKDDNGQVLRWEPFVEMAEAFAEASYQGVYLMDLHTGKFVYTSDYPLLRLGMTAEEMLDRGLEYLADHIPDDEQALIADLGHTIQSNYTEIPIALRPQFMIYMNFHLPAEGRNAMVCHKMRLLDFDADGTAHLLLGLVSPSVHDGSEVVMAGLSSTDWMYSYTVEGKRWERVTKIQLSDDELTMLRLTMQGHSLEQIGALMFKSVETVKFYRRQVFLKLKVKNISEALAYATHYCLI